MKISGGLTPLSNVTPEAADGTAGAAGSALVAARGDHVHALGPAVADLDMNSNDILAAASIALATGTPNTGAGVVSQESNRAYIGDGTDAMEMPNPASVGLIAREASTTSATLVTLASVNAPSGIVSGGLFGGYTVLKSGSFSAAIGWKIGSKGSNYTALYTSTSGYVSRQFSVTRVSASNTMVGDQGNLPPLATTYQSMAGALSVDLAGAVVTLQGYTQDVSDPITLQGVSSLFAWATS